MALLRFTNNYKIWRPHRIYKGLYIMAIKFLILKVPYYGHDNCYIKRIFTIVAPFKTLNIKNFNVHYCRKPQKNYITIIYSLLWGVLL